MREVFWCAANRFGRDVLGEREISVGPKGFSTIASPALFKHERISLSSDSLYSLPLTAARTAKHTSLNERTTGRSLN